MSTTSGSDKLQLQNELRIIFLRAQHHTRKHAAETEFCDVDWTCEGSGLGNKNKTGRVNTAWNQLT